MKTIMTGVLSILSVFSAFVALCDKPTGKEAFPDPSLKPEKVISAEPGMKVYQASAAKMNDRRFSVYIPKSYSHDKPIPMVVSAYDDGDVEKQSEAWDEYAEQYGFIVICPDYKSPEGCKNRAAANFLQEIRNDEKMLKEVTDRVFRSLNIDRRYVMHASYRTGGFPAFYVALGQPKLFTCAAVNSSFYWGERCYGTKFFVTGKPSPSVWSNQPVYLSWEKGDAEIDREDFYGKLEGQEEVKFFTETLRCKKLKKEVYDKGKQSLPSMPAKWFAEEVVAASDVKSEGAEKGK